MTEEEYRLEEFQRESHEKEQRIEAQRLYCAELEYRGELTMNVPLDRLRELCALEEQQNKECEWCNENNKDYHFAFHTDYKFCQYCGKELDLKH